MGNINEIVVRNEAGDYEVIDLDTGEVVQNSRVAATSPVANHEFRFNYAVALQICQLVKQGKTLSQIEKEPGMPPLHVISHWQRSDRMFAEEMKLARKERAEVYHDNAMEIARKAASREYHKDDIPAMALAVKTYQWGAERAKPESYGNKVTHEGSAEKPILMRVINTGISREPKPDIVVVESKEVTDVKQENRSSGSGTEDQGD